MWDWQAQDYSRDESSGIGESYTRQFVIYVFLSDASKFLTCLYMIDRNI